MLTVDEFDTPWVAVAVRVLVDRGDADEVAAVNGFGISSPSRRFSAKAFERPGCR